VKRISLLALSVSSVSALSLVLSVKPAAAIGSCPKVGGDTSCATLITVVTNGSTVITVDPTQPPYDGNDDDLVGIINNTSSALTSLPLSGSNIFGFDGDGICVGYGLTCTGTFSFEYYGTTGGYEGPGTSYTPTNSSSGSVNFTGGLQPGAFAYFGLEAAPTAGGIIAGPPVTQPSSGGTSVPEPSSVLSTLGFGALGAGYMLKRKLKQNKLAA